MAEMGDLIYADHEELDAARKERRGYGLFKVEMDEYDGKEPHTTYYVLACDALTAKHMAMQEFAWTPRATREDRENNPMNTSVEQLTLVDARKYSWNPDHRQMYVTE